jgi:5'-nucleotidase
MKILLTNDDGIYSEGLWALYQQFSEKHSITVVAPDRERSAVGHGITLYEPLRASRVKVNSGYLGYAVNGTPADCIKIGFMEILDAMPDLVISGINPSANLGVNINYSGTVAAAKEAALYRVPSIAVSMQGHLKSNYDDAAFFISSLAEDVMENGLPFGTFLNVNIPDVPMDEIEGVRISRQGNELYDEYMDKRIDPRDRTYYWYGFESRISFDHPDIDGAALEENFISITPIKCDMTDYSMLEDLKAWNIGVRGKK